MEYNSQSYIAQVHACYMDTWLPKMYCLHYRTVAVLSGLFFLVDLVIYLVLQQKYIYIIIISTITVFSCKKISSTLVQCGHDTCIETYKHCLHVWTGLQDSTASGVWVPELIKRLAGITRSILMFTICSEGFLKDKTHSLQRQLYLRLHHKNGTLQIYNIREDNNNNNNRMTIQTTFVKLKCGHILCTSLT